MADETLGNAADHHAPQSAPSVSAHHNKVRAAPLNEAQQRAGDVFGDAPGFHDLRVAHDVHLAHLFLCAIEQRGSDLPRESFVN
jgi:hypothetical protein